MVSSASWSIQLDDFHLSPAKYQPHRFEQTTLKRSALRITREVELLGGEISSSHSRENVVLRAKFLANDLPYFTELLAEVASQPKFAGESIQPH